ncbi:MAG: phospholipase D family protein, partial [Acidobacteriaceae bacterium]
MSFSDRIFSNASGIESIRNAFYLLADQPCDVFLVSPFFSNDELLTDLLQRQCTVRLIVRLGSRTDPGSLTRLVQKPGIQIRYFTSPTFHTKLYIFGQRGALVGSANLTKAGVSSNREVAITVDPADERFDQLLMLFQSYWGHPKIGVLTPQRCAEYAEVAKQATHPEDTFEADILSKFGDLAPEGIQVEATKKESKEKVYLRSYQQTYGEFLAAYRRVEERYNAFARRKRPEADLPIRIEIDQFLSYIREHFAKEESYEQEPFRTGNDLLVNIDRHLERWFETDWVYLDEIVPAYREINRILGSVDGIA